MATLWIHLKNLLTYLVIVPLIIDLDTELAKQRQIAIIWSTEDVQAVRSDLTDDQAWEILQTIKRQHDATRSVNWDIIESVADYLYPEFEME